MSRDLFRIHNGKEIKQKNLRKDRITQLRAEVRDRCIDYFEKIQTSSIANLSMDNIKFCVMDRKALYKHVNGSIMICRRFRKRECWFVQRIVDLGLFETEGIYNTNTAARVGK